MGWLTRKGFMNNENVELYIQDRILAKTLLPFIPKWILPNHVTVARLFLIPLNIYLLLTHEWTALIILFSLTAFTDVVDGAMARVRKQITLWGAILDPTADKLLIASVAGIFLVTEVAHELAFAVIFIEFLIVLGAYSRRRRGEYISANGAGKIKMLLQCVGFGFMLLSKATSIEEFMWIGLAMIVVSLGFAVVSLVTYGL